MGSEQGQMELESRIHDLLNGTLAPRQAADLLARIERDDAARHLAGEMARFQRLARAAAGLEAVESAGADSLQLAQGTIQSGRVEAAMGRRRGGRRIYRSLVWPFRIAALVAVATGATLTFYWHRQAVDLRQQLDRKPAAPIVVADLRPEDLAVLRTLWQGVASSGDQSRPWVLMADGVGAFGYLAQPAGSESPRIERLVLVRCVIVADDRQQTQVSLLLPAGQATPLNLPDACRILDQPVDLTLQAGGQFVDLSLRLGTGTDGSVGLAGRVPAQQSGAHQVGQFHLGERTLTVFLQALQVDPETT
ncbi:MAG: hypothetical protein BIFFINMI_02803 [Phycisphaerae bacterium]|nr:hypothetical protein [Phycisphaerae bacterium]